MKNIKLRVFTLVTGKAILMEEETFINGKDNNHVYDTKDVYEVHFQPKSPTEINILFLPYDKMPFGGKEVIIKDTAIESIMNLDEDSNLYNQFMQFKTGIIVDTKPKIELIK